MKAVVSASEVVVDPVVPTSVFAVLAAARNAAERGAVSPRPAALVCVVKN